MKKHILIYDDDPEILFLCTAILSKYNYEAQTFSRCDNIIADIEKHKPDLILMDLWIPDIGGEKTIAIVKEDKNIKTPILIFSANADIKNLTKKVNADGYIEKPFAINIFIETIQKYIG
ncbi:MAG: response regulator [Chitinophagaceae bacterium]